MNTDNLPTDDLPEDATPSPQGQPTGTSLITPEILKKIVGSCSPQPGESPSITKLREWAQAGNLDVFRERNRADEPHVIVDPDQNSGITSNTTFSASISRNNS